MTKELQNPFLFVGGVPRSGTTLLQRMLDAHPEIAVANDSHFIPRALELTDESLVQDAINGQNIPLTNELVDNVKNYHRFYRMGISDQQFKLAVANSNGYQQFVSRLYDTFASNAGKPLGGEKTPDYSRRLTLLHGLFPNAKLIHLVRDGRNVALSLLQWAKPNKGPGRIELWNDCPIAVCALWWRWLALAGRAQAAEVGSNSVIEVNYESLIDDPGIELNRLCDFLGMPFDTKLLEFNRGRERDQQNLSAKKAWLGPKSGLRDWKTDMPAEEIELFEALAGDALELFGFETSTSGISDETAELAKQCECWWQENFLAQHTACSTTQMRADKLPMSRIGVSGGA